MVIRSTHTLPYDTSRGRARPFRAGHGRQPMTDAFDLARLNRGERARRPDRQVDAGDNHPDEPKQLRYDDQVRDRELHRDQEADGDYTCRHTKPEWQRTMGEAERRDRQQQRSLQVPGHQEGEAVHFEERTGQVRIERLRVIHEGEEWWNA